MFCTVRARPRAELVVAMAPSARRDFERMLLDTRPGGGFSKLVKMVSSVRTERARAFSTADEVRLVGCWVADY